MHPPLSAAGNLLLEALGPADRAAVDRRLTPVDLPTGMDLYVPGQRMTHAWFPVAGIVSMVSELEEGTVEVGTLGREGMYGLPLLLGATETTARAFMQVPGRGFCMEAHALQASIAEAPAFGALLYRYAQALFEQVSQSVACNRLHSLEERCARWLLMVHDSAGEEVLPLKQSFLAEMLGVHRPAVTIAAGALQTAGLIRYSRGRVQVLDRAGLEDAACPCYGIVRDGFERMRGLNPDTK